MYNNKRGQAALEFLMTYGWAILSAIIVIGALGSYFYFNQDGSTSIFVNAPFYGVAASATGTTLSLEIDNRGGETLSSVEVAVDTCTTNTTGFNSSASGPQIITLSSCDMDSGEPFRGDISVSYLRPESALPLTATGSVSTPVA